MFYNLMITLVAVDMYRCRDGLGIERIQTAKRQDIDPFLYAFFLNRLRRVSEKKISKKLPDGFSSFNFLFKIYYQLFILRNVFHFNPCS